MRRRYNPYRKFYPIPEEVGEAFKALRKQGYIARQNFSCCGSCASYDIGTAMTEAIAKGKPKAGGVYYHRQDTERAHDQGKLFIGYFTGCSGDGYDNAGTLELGTAIVKELTDRGLTVEWDGTVNARILVNLAGTEGAA